jgi:hypothetical protein
MQQSERIELIKAAAMLVHALANNAHTKTPQDILNTFDMYYNYLQLKLEATDNANENT